MKILIAEDDLIPRRVLERTLSAWGYEVLAVPDGAAALEVLRKPGSPRLAIIDWIMPEPNGPEVCRQIRSQPTDDTYTYLLLLTGRSETKDIVAGLEAGADDYLTKPFEPAELRARLRVGRRLLEMHAQLVSAREQLRHRATRDPLTEVYNRGAILEILQRELSRGGRERKPVGVILTDVDHFKKINDTHGHPTGDAVLRELTRRFSQAVRPYDSLGRFGGEEFLMVMANCEEDDAIRLAARLRHKVSERPFVTSEGEIPVTVSVGVTVANEPDPSRIEELLKTADAALYQAKHQGRDRVVMLPS